MVGSGEDEAEGAERPARSRLPVETRRAQLLAVARDAFTGTSLDDVSVESLAKRAGVSVGLIYHHFDSKRGLLLAAVRDADAALEEAVVIDPSLEPEERLDVALRGYLEHVARDPGWFASIVRGLAPNDPEVAAILEDRRQRLVSTILAGIPELDGMPDLEEAPIVALLTAGWASLVEDVAARWATGPRDVDVDDLVSAAHKVLEAVLAACGAVEPRVIDAEGRWGRSAEADAVDVLTSESVSP